MPKAEVPVVTYSFVCVLFTVLPQLEMLLSSAKIALFYCAQNRPKNGSDLLITFQTKMFDN